MAEATQNGNGQPTASGNVSTMHGREDGRMDANGTTAHDNETQEAMGSAAGALRDVAHKMRESGSNTSLPGVRTATQAAARPLESSADYIESRSPQDMWSDLMRFGREHPAEALFVGFATGYLFKKLFR